MPRLTHAGPLALKRQSRVPRLSAGPYRDEAKRLPRAHTACSSRTLLLHFFCTARGTWLRTQSNRTQPDEFLKQTSPPHTCSQRILSGNACAAPMQMHALARPRCPPHLLLTPCSAAGTHARTHVESLERATFTHSDPSGHCRGIGHCMHAWHQQRGEGGTSLGEMRLAWRALLPVAA